MTLAMTHISSFLLFAEAGEEEGSFNPILPSLPEIIWSAITFFALWALMKFVLLPPIMEGRDARRAKVSAGADSVSDADAELAQLHEAHEARLADARSEASSIIEAARSEVDAERAAAVGEVEGNIAKLRANAQGEIDAARSSALAGARGTVSELAVGAASKVLGRNIDLSASQSVIDGFLDTRSN